MTPFTNIRAGWQEKNAAEAKINTYALGRFLLDTQGNPAYNESSEQNFRRF